MAGGRLAVSGAVRCLTAALLVTAVLGSSPKPHLSLTGLPVQGHAVTFTCDPPSISNPANPNTTFTIAWLVNDTFLREDWSNNMTLNLSRSHTGVYRCIVKYKDDLGMNSDPSNGVSLEVKIAPEVKLRLLRSRPVREGENVSLICEVTAAMPPVPEDGFTWSFVPFGSDVSKDLSTSTRHVTFDHVTRSDRGHYTCLARNDVTIPPASASLLLDVWCEYD